ncbi:thiamine pyrophosphate-binding protein [Halococcus qingdaonensis]|uniref:thiamine pyrophosphate-binding protein n=1 Tax=Halococcus qingdaonensis TaxID=224402 RepID=UPI0021160338|nr:thiamine pyrophosphate-binding protein [Halococcus qingdaonensis]
MHVSTAVVERLRANGIDTVFGIPGKQSLPLNDGIDRADDIRYVVARHETAVSQAAWGYAETSGRLAATIVVPGPGDMNAMNGLKNAKNDCTPLLHIAIETEPELRGGDAIHETPPDIYDDIVKENLLVETAEATAAEIERAIMIAQTPPKGPVRIGVPKNFLKQDVAVASSTEYELSAPAEPDDVTAAAELLDEARKPIVVAGGGVRTAGAATELSAVAESLRAPIVTTYKGKGVVGGDHPLWLGTLSGSASPELDETLAAADAALVVGSDLDAVATSNWSAPLPDELVHVTLDANDIGTGYSPTIGIVADARATLDELEDRFGDGAGDGWDGAAEVAAVRDAYDERIADLLDAEREPPTSVACLRAVRRAIPDETVVSADAGGFRVWALNVFDAAGPRRYVNPGSWATMGTGLPAAIGAQLSNPEKPVLALCGDGGLMMAVHELHTAVAEDLPITTVVFNNDDYAIISEEAERSYGLESGAYGWPSAALDFPTIAEGMGMTALRADGIADLENRVAEAVGRDEPVLVEVRTDPDEPQASAFMEGA